MQTADVRLQAAIGRWLVTLNDVPGWPEWKRQHLSATLWFDDELPGERAKARDFAFPADIQSQHELIVSYHALHSTLVSLRDCEYYFRRYPFQDLPVSKYDHLRYTCETYFGRFYEFRSRMKVCLNNLDNHVDGSLGIGTLLKAFDREFDEEIRARNRVHHHNRFEDVAIDNLMILETWKASNEERVHLQVRIRAAYQTASRQWSARVRIRSQRVEDYLAGVAEAILLHCKFLR